jgi:hypothetical protein
MSNEPFVDKRQTRQSRFSGGYGGILVALLLTGNAVASNGAPGSLQQMCQEADQLAAAPGERKQAIAAYQAVIEAHLANEALYQSALRQLARCYSDSNQVEEGVRFFIHLGQTLYGERKPDTLKEIFNEFRLKYPERVEKVIREMQSASGRESSVTNVIPSQELSKAILQRGDQVLRDKALERLQSMLASQSSDREKKEGLATLRSVLTAKFDHRPFRDRVLPLLQSENADIRALALGCLPGLEATVDDLARVLALVQDPSPKVRHEVGPALIRIGQGQEQEKVIPALLQLLKDKERDVVEWTIRSMWGQYSSPAFDEFLIQLSRDPQHHHNVIYHCLSTMRSKSLAVCRRLVEELADPDWNNSGRAAWGLTYGVTEEAKGLVEEGLLKALPEETSDYTREQEFRALRGVMTEKSRPYLTSIANSQTETDKCKGLARELLALLAKNPQEHLQ